MAKSQFKRARADEGAARPYRLWDAKTKANVRWRYYGTARRAHYAAMIECRWSQPGTTIEVYDARNGHLHGQYTRTPTTIQFAR